MKKEVFDKIEILKILIILNRCEGIFVIEGGKCLIHRNYIMENNDGIVVIKSIPDIYNNEIMKNKSNGKRNYKIIKFYKDRVKSKARE